MVICWKAKMNSVIQMRPTAWYHTRYWGGPSITYSTTPVKGFFTGSPEWTNERSEQVSLTQTCFPSQKTIAETIFKCYQIKFHWQNCNYDHNRCIMTDLFFPRAHLWLQLLIYIYISFGKRSFWKTRPTWSWLDVLHSVDNWKTRAFVCAELETWTCTASLALLYRNLVRSNTVLFQKLPKVHILSTQSNLFN